MQTYNSHAQSGTLTSSGLQITGIYFNNDKKSWILHEECITKSSVKISDMKDPIHQFTKDKEHLNHLSSDIFCQVSDKQNVH